MNITIKTIRHGDQRYDTVGDWLFNRRTHLHVLVSRMGNRDYEFLVGLHEMIEAWLCQKRKIYEVAITAFDVAFEEKREPGNTDEPGDDPQAPYRREHFFATSIERLMAAELGVDWAEYEKVVNGL